MHAARSLFARSSASLRRSVCCSSSLKTRTPFGLLIDIDGVIFRGRDLLPFVQDAFKLLTDANGKFEVPIVFLTNGTHTMRITRATRLSTSLGIEVSPSQVVMAHSPLRMFSDLHHKHVLMVGQGPIEEMASSMGFKSVSTLADLGTLFPHLDCVNFKRRRLDPSTMPSQDFTPIEAIVLLGEPLKWESALQLLIDVLITNGAPGSPHITRGVVSHPHIPVIACNLDLLWMAEAGLPLPRFGHGCFLTCLETLYRKLTGHHLHYSAFLGKPSEISYLHGAYCVQKQAHQLGLSPIQTLYAIGDNPESDVLGANLFQRYLHNGGVGRFDHYTVKLFEEETCDVAAVRQIRDCFSVLVETGLYHQQCAMNGYVRPVSLLIKDISEKEREILRTPTFVEQNLLKAIEAILARHDV